MIGKLIYLPKRVYIYNCFLLLCGAGTPGLCWRRKLEKAEAEQKQELLRDMGMFQYKLGIGAYSYLGFNRLVRTGQTQRKLWMLQGNLPGGAAPRTPSPAGAALRAGVPMPELVPPRPCVAKIKKEPGGFRSSFGFKKSDGTLVLLRRGRRFMVACGTAHQ